MTEHEHSGKDLSGGPDGAARTPCCFKEIESEPIEGGGGRGPNGKIWRCPECGNEWTHPTETVLRGGPWSEYA